MDPWGRHPTRAPVPACAGRPPRCGVSGPLIWPVTACPSEKPTPSPHPGPQPTQGRTPGHPATATAPGWVLRAPAPVWAQGDILCCILGRTWPGQAAWGHPGLPQRHTSAAGCEGPWALPPSWPSAWAASSLRVAGPPPRAPPSSPNANTGQPCQAAAPGPQQPLPEVGGHTRPEPPSRSLSERGTDWGVGWRGQLRGAARLPPHTHVHTCVPAPNTPTLAAGVGVYYCYKSDITQFGADVAFIRII